MHLDYRIFTGRLTKEIAQSDGASIPWDLSNIMEMPIDGFRHAPEIQPNQKMADFKRNYSLFAKNVPQTILHPQNVLQWGKDETLFHLATQVGLERVEKILDACTIASPVADHANGDWIKQAKIIGINPRALGNFFNIIKYAMTFPEDAVHLLPLYETGCDGSLYAPVSWKLNDEFLSDELKELGFTTADDQLRFVISCLHALGKKVGLDVVPHTDRFSETVLLHPDFFEWIRLNDAKTHEIAAGDAVSESVKDCIVEFLRREGCAEGNPEYDVTEFFNGTLTDAERSEILFGSELDRDKRMYRRLNLMGWLRRHGFETVPVAIYRPYRQARFERMEYSHDGESWPVFSVPGHNPKQIFGSLTPYKFFHVGPDGMPQIDRPHLECRRYFAERVAAMQEKFGFDFMRVDMAHIQLNPEGVKLAPKNEGEMGVWRRVKNAVLPQAPYFASFAEHFVEDKRCSHGDAHQNIEGDAFDAALGNLQYFIPDEDFAERVRRYNLSGLLHGTRFMIANTVSTLDNDNCDNLYANHADNLTRIFLAYFLNQPSYMAMGFEAREGDLQYRKRYSARQYIQDGLKRQEGGYLWHDPGEFFAAVQKLRGHYRGLADELRNLQHWWIESNRNDVLSWVYFDPIQRVRHLFVVRLGNADNVTDVVLQNPYQALERAKQLRAPHKISLSLCYSSLNKNLSGAKVSGADPFGEIHLPELKAGEARIYSMRETY